MSRATITDPRARNDYPRFMAVHAGAVANELRARLPGLGVKKLHKLLYYCQGHHLAAVGEPLFVESVAAWDMGPVVSQLWRAEKDGGSDVAPDDPLDEAHLNTIGYVVSRYGRLTGADLERLAHAEGPWRRADAQRTPGTSTRIEQSWLREWFVGDGEDEDDAVGLPDKDQIRALLSGAQARLQDPSHRDDPSAIRARVAELRRG